MFPQPSLPITDHTSSYRMTAVQELAKFRREWEEATEGLSLLDANASVGLLLADVADRLKLTPQERYVFLGKLLTKEVEDFLQQRVDLAEQ